MDSQEKVNRPKSDAFRQQKLKAWQPILSPLKVVVIFFLIGISFIPTGNYLLGEADDVYEKTITYDGNEIDQNCQIKKENQGKSCNIVFDIDEDVPGPIYVYYEMGNFYQNHRRYVSSVDYYQMSGEKVSQSSLDSTCVENVKENGLLLNPCGLIASSYFTDVIKLNSSASFPSGSFSLDEKDISWPSDKDKFKQPSGFHSVAVSSPNETCKANNLPNGCELFYDKNDDQYYLYYYPDNNSTTYLYEMYPGLISPLVGVEDEHFKVWMRTAALPNFRKLYGKIHSDLKKGDKLVFDLTANYEVDSYSASKSLVITNLGEFGGKNPYLGIAYIVVGSISIFFSLLFTMKQLLAPRRKADESMIDFNPKN